MMLKILILLTIYYVNGQLEAEIDDIINDIDKGVIDTSGNNLQGSNTKQDKDLHRDPLDPYTSDNSNRNNQNYDDLFKVPENPQCIDKCVPFYQCNNGSVNTNGEGLINIRGNDGPCGNAFLTCCKLEYVTSGRISTPAPYVPKQQGCGVRHPNGVGFKVTGIKNNEAQFAEFPWMVSIINITRLLDPNPRPYCGGSLIHPKAVITAAHCVSDLTQRWKVRVGEWDIMKTIEPISHQEVDVDSLTIHEQYYAGAVYNDIAFLYLKSPVKLADNVGTICLPPQDFQHRPGRCFSTGWGKDRFGKQGKYQVILKKIDLPVIPKEICEENLRETRLGKFFELHSSFMCAGGEKGKDACNGDGGSPLVCLVDGKEASKYYQAGIVSWGIGCGEENVPGVYVDVAKFRRWIDKEMKNRNLDTVWYIVNSEIDPRSGQ